MGAVCRATDERLGRDVAVKVLTVAPTDEREQEVLRQRFHREARAAAALRHPNVVTVHDFGTDEELGLDFLVMELLPGEDVAGRLARAGGALSVPEALEIVREAAMGLAAGHRAGLVHRDVKPGNIFLVADPAGGWEVKVLDFGIAALTAADTLPRLTRAGLGPHTPKYAAPEQLRGESVTPACDVYSLALTGLELLTGRYCDGVNSADGDRPATRVLAGLHDAAPDVFTLPIAAAFHRALLREPARRFAGADEMLATLDRAIARGPVTAAGARAAAEAEAAFASARASTSQPYPLPPRPQPPAAQARPAFTVPPPPPPEPITRTRQPGRRDVEEPSSSWPWLVAIFVLVPMILVFVIAGQGANERGDPPAEYPEAAAASPEVGALMDSVARAEALRVSALQGPVAPVDTLSIVVLASYPETDYGRASDDFRRLRDLGMRVGLANSRVYPQLRDGYLALVAGPFDAGEAGNELERLRREVAGDAFLKRVTMDSRY
jgi:serine/threonine protein kinase